MKKYMKPIEMGEMLEEEFMKPFGLSAYKLAKLINVPVSRIQDILHNRRKMSIDTSMRLGKLFGMDDLFFFRLQLDLDYQKAKIEAAQELERIQRINKHPEAFLKSKAKLQTELDNITKISVEE